ncbi:MAG TPA: hypothetical protein DCQ63_17790, partial [Planktothrix sp. UBA8402]|nr:hypothetical protein [Planktothrix sp. UBA8402]
FDSHMLHSPILLKPLWNFPRWFLVLAGNGRSSLILLIVTSDFRAMGKEMTHQDFLFGCGGMGINQIG